MKQIKCELCGSTDLVKDGGFFVCQYCGAKYSVEEARKMMIEGTVDVQGTVKIDNSSSVQNYLDNARRARQKEDWEEVEKYYNLVEQNDPKSIEAIFYSAFAKAYLSLFDNLSPKRAQIYNVFCNSISVIDDNYDVEKGEENQKLIQQFDSDLWKLYNKGDNYVKSTKLLVANAAISFVDSLKNITMIDDQLLYWKIIYEHERYIASNNAVDSATRKKFSQEAEEIAAKIQERDPSSEIKNVPQTGNGGCYLTTACVEQRGLPDDCDELTTLRLFRDGYMKAQPGGKEDILEYYEKAPKIVEIISRQNNKNEVYDYIYNDVIVPCVKYIKNGENEAAYEKYRAMVKQLETEYLS